MERADNNSPWSQPILPFVPFIVPCFTYYEDSLISCPFSLYPVDISLVFCGLLQCFSPSEHCWISLQHDNLPTPFVQQCALEKQLTSPMPHLQLACFCGIIKCITGTIVTIFTLSTIQCTYQPTLYMKQWHCDQLLTSLMLHLQATCFRYITADITDTTVDPFIKRGCCCIH